MNPQQYPQQPVQPQAYPPQPQQGPYPQAPGMMPSQPYPNAAMPGMPAQPPLPIQPYGPQPAPHPQIISPPQLNPTLGYNPYPYPNEYDQPTRRGPNKFLIVIIILFSVILVVIGLIALSSDSNNTGNTNTNTNQTNQTTTTTTDQSGNDIVPRNDGQLDLRSKISLTKNLKAQTLKATMKQQVNLSSGFSFMVNKVEDYTSPNAATKAAAGKKFVVATVVVGNRNDSGSLSVSYLDFRLRDDNNQVTAASTVTNELLNNPLSSPSEIKTGEQLTGKVIFEVAADSTSWVLMHTETYQKSTDNTTFNVEGDIVVSTVAATSTSSTSTTGTQTTSP